MLAQSVGNIDSLLGVVSDPTNPTEIFDTARLRGQCFFLLFFFFVFFALSCSSASGCL